eukprot:TRINITY_DN2756_c0_g8_i1.p1 TRINITY_DN2756_c0_g8~~TRINITY_DN2756_c0_g8_i1.p1  ORF type:complete len:426 (+),score=144.32 TRINITY_DN2756_c0_g8_i1:122-1399(+)
MDRNYVRESYNRHKSEKVLDTFLFRAERREAEKLQKELLFLKKRNEAIALAKKRKLRQYSSTSSEASKKFKEEAKDNASEIKPNDKPAKENPEDTKEHEEKKKPNKSNSATKHIVDPYAALIKIVKHIATPSKYSKCLPMLKELLTNCIDIFDASSVFTIVDLLCWSPYKFKLQQDGYALKELFTFVLEYAENNSPYFSYDQEVMIELFQIPAILHAQLFTDDSFQFNRVMSDLDEILDDLINDENSIDEKYGMPYEERHAKILNILTRKKDLRDKLAVDEGAVSEEEIEKLIDEYSYSQSEDIKALARYAKRKFLLDCLRDVVPYAQKTWGKTSVIKLLKKAYLERRVFSEEEQEELGDMVSIASSKVTISEKRNMAKKYMDEKIKATPSDNYYPVTDGRDEVYGIGDLDEWATRQFGLNPSKR